MFLAGCSSHSLSFLDELLMAVVFLWPLALGALLGGGFLVYLAIKSNPSSGAAVSKAPSGESYYA